MHCSQSIRLVRLNRDRMLFAFCDPAILGDGGPLPSTTNQLDGRRQRRGQTDARPSPGPVGGAYETMLRMGGLHARSRPGSHVARRARTLEGEERESGRGRRACACAEVAVQLPAAGAEAYENGFGIRKGWAGLSH